MDQMTRVNMVSTALIALVLSLGAWLTGAPAAAAQEADGLKTVTATGNGATKNQARDDALRQAVEQGVGVVITSRTETLDHAVAFDRVVSRSEGYVKSFTVGEETKDAATGVWAVTLTAQVAVGKIKDDWGQIQLLLQQKGQPTVMVLIRETIRNHRNESLPASTSYCARSIEKLLLAKGFRVKSVGGLAEKERRERDAAVQADDAGKLAAIALNYGANIMITGDMTCRFDRATDSYGIKLRRYVATAGLSAYRTDTADVMASVQVSGIGSEPGDAEAQAKALVNASADVGDELLKELLNQWYFEFQQGQRFAMELTITAEVAKKMRKADRFSLKFQDLLSEEVEGVSEVTEENFTKADGKAVVRLTITSTLNQKDLRLAIGDLETDDAGYWLEYMGGDKSSLRYALHIE